jgi:hypothetical protein
MKKQFAANCLIEKMDKSKRLIDEGLAFSKYSELEECKDEKEKPRLIVEVKALMEQNGRQMCDRSPDLSHEGNQ